MNLLPRGQRFFIIASALGRRLFLQKMWLCGLLTLATAISPALAQTDGKDALIAKLEARIDAQDRRIRQLEDFMRSARLDGPAAASPGNHVPAPEPGGATAENRAEPVTAALTPVAQRPAPPVSVATTQADKQDRETSRLTLGGDLRLRYEHNFSDADAIDDARGVIRARLRAHYAANDWLTLGAQIATGDQGDPNSADVTLANFDDDLDVSLDRAFAHVATGNIELWGGKFPNPFTRTDLVWDGDVNPQGIGARYTLPLGEMASLAATAIYFPIDRSVGGADSHMTGGQIEVVAHSGAFDFGLSGAYYDYRLGAIETANAGDLRSNLIGQGGRYLSDFNLLNAIGSITYGGLGERWPVTLVGDYVHNLGAATDADTGYGFSIAAGRMKQQGDWKLGYSYLSSETDAVFAAFSHDNIGLATNYRLHALTADYLAWDNIAFNGTLYIYRPNSSLFGIAAQDDDWVNRLRLNMLFSF